MQKQEIFSALIHVERLRGKLAAAAARGAPTSALDLLQGFASGQPQAALPTHQDLRASVDEKLNSIFGILLDDVMAARDRLIALNPGRRTMIERRLEFVARKVARQRGERFNRSLSLTDILRESFRENPEGEPTLGQAAWNGFAAEAALYHMLELFFLKSLDFHGWRPFAQGDLGRMYFASRDFLTQRAADFALDKHCWNFVRTNLYSWHVPSAASQAKIQPLLEDMTLSWSDQDLLSWASALPARFRLGYLEVRNETKAAEVMLSFLEEKLGRPLVTDFQGSPVCRKIFIPALELGGVALTALERMLRQANGSVLSSDANVKAQQFQLQRALWACESESLEIYWTEVMSLLKTLRWTSMDKVLASARMSPLGEGMTLCRLPHVVHAVQTLGLELHNLEQLPLGGPEISRLHQGSAGQIQQTETFDLALVTDHPDRAKSGRWMNALAAQLPYWRAILTSGTNLNWGELHLHLALSKLKEDGYCLYLTHRVLPEGGDGDRLRKLLLGQCTFEYFLELDESECPPYRYLYVFRRVSGKLERDNHRPCFGKLEGNQAKAQSYEEASSTQAEIAERGWDHLFVRGAAPLVRHLNHKFPKLFQLASVQLGSPLQEPGSEPQSPPLVRSASVGNNCLSVSPGPQGARFLPGQTGAILVFPHNPADLQWMECLLNSTPAQFWIRHAGSSRAAASGKSERLSAREAFQDLRSVPIVDLTRAPADSVHEAVEWLGRHGQDQSKLDAWTSDREATIVELQARFVALSRNYCSLESLFDRYRPLVQDDEGLEVRPEAVTRFYPERMLCHIPQSPDIRIQYSGRERTSLLPENWTVAEAHIVNGAAAGRAAAGFVVVSTRQGPQIQILAPLAALRYVASQFKDLRDHTWGEALSMVRVPRDVGLFSAQAGEITRVLMQTRSEMAACRRALDTLAMSLFEISPELRQFLVS